MIYGLSIGLTFCLTAIKSHVMKQFLRGMLKSTMVNKNSGESLDKVKSNGFLVSCLSTHDFTYLYATFLHNLIKEKLTELIEQTFNRQCSLYLACKENAHFSFLNNLKDIICGHVRK